MDIDVAGREVELGRIDDFVTDQRPGCRVLLLEGGPGIGKTTLWSAGVDRARREGVRVLTARPAEREQDLALAGLGDLLEEELEDVLPQLVLPRRQALATALLREEAGSLPSDHRALAVAVRDSLQLLAQRGRLLVAIDDLQWLDAPSMAALVFALRRMASERLLVLVARRPTADGDAPSYEGTLDELGAVRLELDGLSVGALHRMLRDRLGRPVPHQTLLRIHERSGGNPFFALELGRALEAHEDGPDLLTVPTTVERLVRERLTGLPTSTRDALSVASAVGTASSTLLERVGVSSRALRPAHTAHVIEWDDGVLRFTHPLLSSVLYADLGDVRRREVHARIAEGVDDPLERAHHVALATPAPDPAVAEMLDDAAAVAARLGAQAVVADLAEHAIRLTPPGDPARRRQRALVAARAHQAAGEWTRSRAILTSILDGPVSGTDRADVLVHLAELESVDRSSELLEEALDQAAGHPLLQAQIECRLAWARRLRAGIGHAHAAVTLAEDVGDDLVLARTRAVEAVLTWFTGARPAPDDFLDVAQHLPGALGGDRLVQEGMLAVVNTYAPAPQRAAVHGFLEREHRRWRERDEPRSAHALWGVAWMEFWAGHWEVASGHAVQALDISTQYGLEVPQDHLPIAVIAVHRGDQATARRHAERALRLADEQFGGPPPQHQAVLGLAALQDGHSSDALRWLTRADRTATEMGWGEPSVRWWTGDLVELLLGQGRFDEAEHLLDVWEADAERVSRAWVQGHAARCRGFVALANAEVDQAVAWFGRAVERHEAVGDPFGRARALLASGVAHRRERQKNAAREALESARAGFTEIGATGWTARTEAELGRISGRQRVAGLTAAERRVATLVAEGATNREVAASLFLGERTVASHLTHVYAKLGVRSRTELARLVNVQGLTDQPPETSPMSRRSDGSKALSEP